MRTVLKGNMFVLDDIHHVLKLSIPEAIFPSHPPRSPLLILLACPAFYPPLQAASVTALQFNRHHNLRRALGRVGFMTRGQPVALCPMLEQEVSFCYQDYQDIYGFVTSIPGIRQLSQRVGRSFSMAYSGLQTAFYVDCAFSVSLKVMYE